VEESLFFLQKTDDPADLLQRETSLAQIAKHGHLGQIVEGIDTLMPFPRRDYYTALVPPLKLTRGYTGQRRHLARCKCFLHRSNSKQIAQEMFETS
jgi:hypothetical protein